MKFTYKKYFSSPPPILIGLIDIYNNYNTDLILITNYIILSIQKFVMNSWNFSIHSWLKMLFFFIYRISIFLLYVWRKSRTINARIAENQVTLENDKAIKPGKLFSLLKKPFPQSHHTTLFAQRHKIILCYCLRFKLTPTTRAITRRCDCDHGPTPVELPTT